MTRQFATYLLVGAGNTVFGYGSYAVLTWILEPWLPVPYLFASVLASLLNITVSFLGYKLLVFRTRGNYLREWSRSVVVYGGSIALGLLLLPLLVLGFDRLVDPSLSPYAAGAVLIGGQAVLGFLAHSRFTFGTTPDPRAADGPGQAERGPHGRAGRGDAQ